jgi:hypothetical protein
MFFFYGQIIEVLLMLSTQKNTEVIVILIIIRIFLLCVNFFFKEAKMEYIYQKVTKQSSRHKGYQGSLQKFTKEFQEVAQ